MPRPKLVLLLLFQFTFDHKIKTEKCFFFESFYPIVPLSLRSSYWEYNLQICVTSFFNNPETLNLIRLIFYRRLVCLYVFSVCLLMQLSLGELFYIKNLFWIWYSTQIKSKQKILTTLAMEWIFLMLKMLNLVINS